jgi:hypothetical protein
MRTVWSDLVRWLPQLHRSQQSSSTAGAQSLFAYLQEFYERVLNLINDYDAELYHELALAFECARLFQSSCLCTHVWSNRV